MIETKSGKILQDFGKLCKSIFSMVVSPGNDYVYLGDTVGDLIGPFLLTKKFRTQKLKLKFLFYLKCGLYTSFIEKNGCSQANTSFQYNS